MRNRKWRTKPSSDLEIERKLRCPLALRAAVAVLQLGGLRADLVQRRDAARDEDVAADDGAFADDRVAAEDRGAGVDRDVVLDRRVPLLAAEHLPVGGREGAEGDALVELHVVADRRRLA